MPDIRPELSKKNQYWIDRHRYYELKHFCLQYKNWKVYIQEIDGMSPEKFPMGKFARNFPIRSCLLSSFGKNIP